MYLEGCDFSMGKAEERSRVDCVVVYEKGLIWFEGMPVVVCESGRLRAFFICLVGYAETYEFEIKDVKLRLYFN